MFSLNLAERDEVDNKLTNEIERKDSSDEVSGDTIEIERDDNLGEGVGEIAMRVMMYLKEMIVSGEEERHERNEKEERHTENEQGGEGKGMKKVVRKRVVRKRDNLRLLRKRNSLWMRRLLRTRDSLMMMRRMMMRRMMMRSLMMRRVLSKRDSLKMRRKVEKCVLCGSYTPA